MTGTILKIIFGALLVIGSVYYVFSGIPGYVGPALGDLITVINGAVPIFVFLIGIFIVWLELDELKVEKELSAKSKRK